MAKKFIIVFFLLISIANFAINNPVRINVGGSDGAFDEYDTLAVDTTEYDTLAVDTVCDIDYIDDDGVIYSTWGNFVPAYNPDYDDDYAVTTVAGVDFGDSRYTAISKFKSRFGYQYIDNGTNITFYSPNVGGNDFTYGEFYFDNDMFAAAQLIKVFKSNEFAKAKQFRDLLATQYGTKYKNINSRIDKDGYKYYRCGRLVKNAYPIIIYVFKGQSKGGQMMYYVHVDYFDIDSSLNNDIQVRRKIKC